MRIASLERLQTLLSFAFGIPALRAALRGHLKQLTPSDGQLGANMKP